VTATEILIAAHGEAWTCSPDGAPAPGSLAGLSGDGARQSRLLAAALARETGARGAFGAVYSCPSLRCLETAGPIAAALGLDLRAAPTSRAGGAGTCSGPGGFC
jgi:broad specificity phosphatase PhoE